MFPALCELLTIALVTHGLRDEKMLRLLLPLCLALNPGLFATSVLWGQAESVMTLLLVLALAALNRDKPHFAWIFYTLALMTKVQSIVLIPLLVVLTLRRYGVRALAISSVGASLLIAFILLPFIAVSGVDGTLRPFISAVYPAPTSVNAFNIWYWLTPPPAGDLWSVPHGAALDVLPMFGHITYRQVGLALVSVYTLLICITMWRQPQDKREFLWAMALYAGFFMLATKIHERYLFPAVVFAIIAVAQDRRAWLVALGISFTYLYNIAYTLDTHLFWLGIPLLRLLPGTLLQAVLLLNVAFLLEALRLLYLRRTRWLKYTAGAIAFAVIPLTGLFAQTTLPFNASPLETDFTPLLRLEGYERGGSQLVLHWRVNDELPQGTYRVRIESQADALYATQSDTLLQAGNLPFHLSWAGRLVSISYTVDPTVEDFYVTVYADGIYKPLGVRVMIHAP
jgi:hypothetical protein